MVMLASSLLGCGQSVDYAGKYVLSEASSGSSVFSGDQLAEMFPPADNYIEITDSKALTFVMTGESVKCTYTKDGDILSVSDGVDTFEFTLKDNVISFTFEGVTFKYTKS